MDQIMDVFDSFNHSFFGGEWVCRMEELPEENFTNLEKAIQIGSYPRINRELRRERFLFSPAASFRLMVGALSSKLTRRCIQGILERCPPVPEFLNSGALTRMSPQQTYGLTEKAALMGRADVLELLLDRGAGPNRLEDGGLSPLEAALEAEAPECVELLVKRPDLDVAWTEYLLELWCREDEGNIGLELCRQAIVSRFLDPDWVPLDPVPIPEEMTLSLPAARGNWDMVIRICRERPGERIGFQEAREALARMDFQGFEEKRSRLGEAIDAVLTVHPELLRRETACRTVLRGWLFLSPEERAPLERWVKRLESRRVAMEERDWMDTIPPGDFLSRWERLLPRGPVLAVDRWTTFSRDPLLCPVVLTRGDPEPSFPLERILQRCPIRGRGRRGRLSPLAMRVLVQGGPGLVMESLRPGKLLDQEDPDALLEYAESGGVPRVNRNALLVSLRKEERYEL